MGGNAHRPCEHCGVVIGVQAGDVWIVYEPYTVTTVYWCERCRTKPRRHFRYVPVDGVESPEPRR